MEKMIKRTVTMADESDGIESIMKQCKGYDVKAVPTGDADINGHSEWTVEGAKDSLQRWYYVWYMQGAVGNGFDFDVMGVE